MKGITVKIALIMLVAAVGLGLAPGAVQAAAGPGSESEILSTAASVLKNGGSVEQALVVGLMAASDSAIPPAEISAGLAESILAAALGKGQDPTKAAVQITCGAIGWLEGQGTPTAERARVVSQVIMGLRAEAYRAGLDSEALRKSLEAGVSQCSQGVGPVMARVVLGAFAEAGAETYTPIGYEFLAQAAAAMRDEKPLPDIVDRAFTEADKAGLSPVKIASGLSETLMGTGLSMGLEGPQLAGQITCSVILWLEEAGYTTPERARVVAETVLGIRAMAERKGLENKLFQAQIENSVKACAGQMGPIFAKVVGDSFGGESETFTPPIPKGPGVPPGDIPPEIIASDS